VLKVPVNFDWEGFQEWFDDANITKWPRVAKIMCTDWGYAFIDHTNITDEAFCTKVSARSHACCLMWFESHPTLRIINA
jgi:hypothetical protein